MLKSLKRNPMIIKALVSSISALLLLQSAATQAGSKQIDFTGVVIFGDSLSDSGNVHDLLSTLNNRNYDSKYLAFPKLHTPVPWYRDKIYSGAAYALQYAVAGKVMTAPSPIYYHAGFSNGPMWSEYFLKQLNYPKQDAARGNDITIKQNMESALADKYTDSDSPYVHVGQKIYNRAFGGSWAAAEAKFENVNRKGIIDNLVDMGKVSQIVIDHLSNVVYGKYVPPSLPLSVEAYIQEKNHRYDEQTKLDNQALYILYAGANDYLSADDLYLSFQDLGAYALQTKASQVGEENYAMCTAALADSTDSALSTAALQLKHYESFVMDGILKSVDMLTANGAKNILTVNLPYVSPSPYYQNVIKDKNLDEAAAKQFRAGLDCAIDYHNFLLSKAVDERNALTQAEATGQKFALFNANKVFDKYLSEAYKQQALVNQGQTLSAPQPFITEASCLVSEPTDVTDNPDDYIENQFAKNASLRTARATTTQSLTPKLLGFNKSVSSCHQHCFANDPSCSQVCANYQDEQGMTHCIADFVFWDDMHPTTHVQKAIAAEFCNTENYPGYSINCR